MLKIQSLKAQFSKQIPTKNPKYLRISLQNFVKGTKKPGKIIGNKVIQWQDSIVLPNEFKKIFYFQIYDKHQFGYNPEELDKVVHGQLSIQMNDQKGKWEILNYDKQKIGHLSALIRYKTPAVIKQKPTIIKQDPNEHQEQIFNKIKIKSIVGHFPFSRFKRAIIKIKIGEKQIKSCEIKSRKGQIVCIQQIRLQKSPQQTSAKIQVYSIQDEKQILLGQGIFHMVGKKPPKKVIMNKDNVQCIGQIFIQSKVINKKKKNSVLQASSKSLKLDQSIVDNSHIQSKSYMFDQDMVSSSRVSKLSSKKHLSGLYQNKNISFSKQQRFKIYSQKQNDRVSYLQQKNNFQFKPPYQKKHYRGASLGFGNKVDFSLQQKKNDIPGVGRYKLPSLWDRY